MISIVQYNKLSSLFYHDMDVRSRIVLGSMADNISHTLELTETTMKENEWEIRHYLPYPDSMFNAIVRLIDDNRHVVGGCIGFVPDYYRSKGRLFEPYVAKTGDNGYRMEQIAGEDHDYTQTHIVISSDGGDGGLYDINTTVQLIDLVTGETLAACQYHESQSGHDGDRDEVLNGELMPVLRELVTVR